MRLSWHSHGAICAPSRLPALFSSLYLRTLFGLFVCAFFVQTVYGQKIGGEDSPQFEYAAHSRGNIQLTMTNWGQFGIAPGGGYLDPLTGDRVYGCIYPRNSLLRYISGAVAIGAVVAYDTLVSNWHELNPDAFPFGRFRALSIDPTSTAFSEEARSELDLICTYYDTLTDPRYAPVDSWDNRPHVPLGIRIDQRSMSWSSSNVDDFVLVQYEVRNIGKNDLKEAYIRIRAYNTVSYVLNPTSNVGGLSGFLHTWPSDQGCGSLDNVDVAYTIHPHGAKAYSDWDMRTARAAVGVRVLELPAGAYARNFNWYSQTRTVDEPLSWGPRLRGEPGDPFRPISAGLGTPLGDRNNYYVMRHPEHDYDQLFTHLDHTSEGWLPPPDNARGYSLGSWIVRFEQSVGPFDLMPGDHVYFTVAIVGGDSVHTDPTSYESLFYSEYPNVEPYYNRLDFSPLAENTRWASWVYDNPGYDTDGDGYAGDFTMCDGDTLWYRGDGVPDFRADMPPPAPLTKVTPTSTRLVIRWNGYYAETFIDPITRIKDFEGYRVYAGLDSRKSSLSLLSSFDHDNFARYTLIMASDSTYKWVLGDVPFTLDSLRQIYDDSSFAPLRYTRVNPYEYSDTSYYFTKQDFNMSDLSDPGGIHKVYPEASEPSDDPDLWADDELTIEHGEPLPKYYEYEYVYDRLLPTIPYFVSVSAFDFGSGGIPPKESSVLNNLITAYAQMSPDTVTEYGLDAYVYPNPWRSDANYRERGFENRDQSEIPNRSRRIHFANLPAKCKIHIYSLDGDLIRTLDHDYPSDSPEAMHDEWNMVTRNAMLCVSGMYYYVIESDTRMQVGTFVIIF